MPLYEFACADCGEACELLIRNGETPACPNCRGNRLEKLLSVPAAHSASSGPLPMAGEPFRPCGMGGCGRPECD